MYRASFRGATSGGCVLQRIENDEIVLREALIWYCFWKQHVKDKQHIMFMDYLPDKSLNLCLGFYLIS